MNTKITVKGYFEADHDRLGSLFKTFQELKRKNFTEAKRAFVEFKFGLQRHIIWEEDILFPLFERKSGVNPKTGPTSVMRAEHRQIHEALDAIHAQVAKGSPETDSEEAMLLSVLSQHNLKEEKILYPAMDHLMSAGEIAEVYRQMEKVPPERYEHCC
ncbi:MAG: hemerythrin domain-containing protein [Deltaproteobacteria bacterium]|nr:hemerythrin domain-containing protein [Deltaproteobacteria bacterium]MBI2501592.1 hemerythrin domain-containing protein [Deltaproteobacteria bacterium]MBI4196431.1 hemerythrin domain-containing protein [Deltaproteobacteria bacterium]